MADFEEMFPDTFKDDNAVRVINEDSMKSPAGKQKWREFIAKYEKKGTCFSH